MLETCRLKMYVLFLPESSHFVAHNMEDAFYKLQICKKTQSLTWSGCWFILLSLGFLLSFNSLSAQFFSPTHLSPRGHCQQEEGLGRSARQSVLLACTQAVELTSTAHSNWASEPISQGLPKKETAVALQRIAQLAGLRLASSDRSFERCCHITPKGEVRKRKKEMKKGSHR